MGMEEAASGRQTDKGTAAASYHARLVIGSEAGRPPLQNPGPLPRTVGPEDRHGRAVRTLGSNGQRLQQPSTAYRRVPLMILFGFGA